ncbi:histidine phosphatase family protein [Streptomyces alkaliterrae]|uniref:Histidine phosphatase family protein n=1 Tax=Streptomyces alkaliterrae TaxID=2213162 RepID=A0A5P0YL55_9ACTN|nr:histidine phosphatase family protein [Streptomyces alkaliterrae]MBB1251777.1 histidine phosphatase family protein [Streptomyces alkaliterrae]MBB1257790.1 histidine phosphatase family protein [Streptomyces alkaliterrae]MQS01016.1 histidine phosphatase family protein [Streptomyces alkaliterrae]
MSLHVIFVRHGETVWHAENRYAGTTDVTLTERGRAQSRALADWAEHAELTAVFASPLRRSQETARDSAALAGLPVTVDERLRELDFGIAEGLTRAEMRQRFPDHLAAFLTDPVANHFPKGENPLDASDRYLDFLTDLQAAHEGRVLVVGHSTAIRLTLCRLLGLPLHGYRRTFPFLANCALNELVLNGDGPSLLTLNRPVTPGAPK